MTKNRLNVTITTQTHSDDDAVLRSKSLFQCFPKLPELIRQPRLILVDFKNLAFYKHVSSSTPALIISQHALYANSKEKRPKELQRMRFA